MQIMKTIRPPHPRRPVHDKAAPRAHEPAEVSGVLHPCRTAALDQRIATRYQLAPMDLAELAHYLRHHLALVGRTDQLFADDAIARLHKVSFGPPRALNNAAIGALIAAAAAGKSLVDNDCVKKAVAELRRD